MMGYIYLAIAAVAITFGGSMYWQYSSTISENKELTVLIENERASNKVLAGEVMQAKADRIQLEENYDDNARELNSLLLKFAALEKEKKQLENLYAKHDFNYLFQEKPGLILTRANRASELVFVNFANSINRDIAATEEDHLPASTTD